MEAFINWLMSNKVMLLTILLSISEILGTFDYFKNSSIFGLVVSWIKKIKEAIVPPAQP